MRDIFAAAVLCLVVAGFPPGPSPSPTPSPDSYPNNASKANCDSVDSCSPTSFCQRVTNKACSAPEPSIDMAAEIKSLGCRQCTQAPSSKHPMCSAASLKKTLVQPSAIQAAFCNDDFLVIWSLGRPNHATNLNGVPRPPGGGGGGSYDDQCVTRSFVTQSQTFKIPLNYSLLADGRKNVLPSGAQLPSEDLPMSGATGVMINGVPIYPNEDNRGETIQDACEADRCMAHVGMGFDYHYHGDPFGHTCLYSDDNFTGSHPTVIGWGADGPTIYGRYTSSSQDGYSLDLDSCGGHTHDPYGYHYHPVVVESTNSESGDKYTAALISPVNCWKGDVSKIANFWMSSSDWRWFVENVGKTENPGAPTQINYDNSKTNPPYTPKYRNDVEQITPCCTTSEYYTAPGITLPINGESVVV